MSSIVGLDFAPLVPIPLLIGLALLAVPVLGLGAVRGAPGTVWRAIVIGAGLLALLNPTLFREQRDAVTDVAAVIVDRSASQDIGDRVARTDAALKAVTDRLAGISGMDLRIVTVGPDRVAEGTPLIGAMEQAFADVAPERVAGVIVITDGQAHDVPDDPAVLAGYGPVHVLLTGERGETDRRLIVEQAPSYGVVGDRLSIVVRVEDAGAEGTSVRVSVRAEDGRGGSTMIVVGEPATLDFTLDHPGQTALEFKVEPGDDELTLDNNRVVSLINGVRDRLRVMLVSGEPSPGLRAWRNLLKADPAVDLIHFTILRPPNKQDLTPVRELSLIPFPSGELFAANLSEFDLIIFDRYHRRGILPMIYLQNVVEYVHRGGAMLVAAGPSFATDLSLAGTPLAMVLPARPTGEIYNQPFRPRLSDAGRRHPVTADLPGAGDPHAEGDAAEPSWGRWFRQIGAETTRGAALMTGVDAQPVLILDRVGEGRVAQLLSDQSWLWARGVDGGGPQSDLLRRLVHWLMKEPDLEEDGLVGRAEGNRITVTRRSLSPVDEAVLVIAPSGAREKITLADQGDGRALTTMEAKESGLYRLEQGDERAAVLVGAANPREVADVRTTENILKPVVDVGGGSITWLAERDRSLDVRRVAPDRATQGAGWIGLVGNRQYVVSGLAQLPLLPVWLLLALTAGALLIAWRAESR